MHQEEVFSTVKIFGLKFVLSFNATFSSGKEKKDVFWWLEV